MIQSFFSPGPNCLNHITALIRSASEKIDICVFTISDDRIRDAINNAWNRGIDIRIITDNYKVFDEGSDIEFLYNCGITIKVDETENHMHHKFMIVDNLTVLTGSYNWTRSAEKYNSENVVSMINKNLAYHFISEFEHLWEICTEYSTDK
jgi:phosphatidylserine/phosphatidylglycerophosphate/cardiolipin synthase-like enzyme